MVEVAFDVHHNERLAGSLRPSAAMIAALKFGVVLMVVAHTCYLIKRKCLQEEGKREPILDFRAFVALARTPQCGTAAYIISNQQEDDRLNRWLVLHAVILEDGPAST